MADREKIIEDAEQAIEMLGTIEEPTWECDFIRVSFENALELLKAQETRIMSREEIENADGYIWFEDKAQKVMQARYFRKGILFEIGCLPFASKKLNWETYGTLWRYWTAMPTDEQRMEAKWD